LRIHPILITSYAQLKKAAAQTNLDLGKLEKNVGDAIIAAADEVIDGRWNDQFDLDVFQAGAGTSYNMNLNEVIANRALELIGRSWGDYEVVEPNDHVNKGQSTNDTMPTAMRVAAIKLLDNLFAALDELVASLNSKGQEFRRVNKSGRIHLHDAVPMTLGTEFEAYAVNVQQASKRLFQMRNNLLAVPLGGTAVGTGTNATDGLQPKLSASSLILHLSNCARPKTVPLLSKALVISYRFPHAFVVCPWNCPRLPMIYDC